MTTEFTIQIAAWLCLGIFGSYLIRIADGIGFGISWCLSPKAIVLILIGSLGGPVMIVLGIMFSLVSLAMEFNDRVLRGTWWDRPICRKDD